MSKHNSRVPQHYPVPGHWSEAQSQLEHEPFPEDNALDARRLTLPDGPVVVEALVDLHDGDRFQQAGSRFLLRDCRSRFSFISMRLINGAVATPVPVTGSSELMKSEQPAAPTMTLAEAGREQSKGLIDVL